MLNRLLSPVKSRFSIAAIFVAMALVFAISTIQAQQDGPIEYQENGDGPVLTLSSADPEGAGIDWDVTGIDADDFEISSGGVLTFKKSPNFENPTSRPHADAIDVNGNGTTDGDDDRGEAAQAADGPADNFYQITIRATETSGYEGRALSTETRVTVEVTDQNEPGTLTLNRLQPEVGTELTATLGDPEGTGGVDGDGTVTWTWYVSKATNPVADQERHWRLATGNSEDTAATETAAAMSTYIPHGDCVDDKQPGNDGGCPATGQTDTDTTVDEGKMVRAVAMYADSLGTGRKAIVVSNNPVRPEVSSDLDNVENPANGSPGFTQGGDYARTISESAASGTNVGAPVVAREPNDDTLTYELDAAAEPNEADVGSFSIDKATGQIKVAGTLDADSAEGRADDTVAGVYKVLVRAIDPSNETAEVEVTVTVTQANDGPKIRGSVTSGDAPVAPTELRVLEQDSDPGTTYYGTSNGLMGEGVGAEGDGPGFREGLPVALHLGNENVFTATDQDVRGQIFWSLMGDDADQFELSSTGLETVVDEKAIEPIAIIFKVAPDYEAPTDANEDSVYEVILVARDRFDPNMGANDMRPLTIFVDNVNEKGKVTLTAAGDNPDQPLIDNMITAAVEDPDNGVAVITWQWRRSLDGTTFAVIPGATTSTYTPVTVTPVTATSYDDDGYFLRAIATYTDMTSENDDPDTSNIDERVQKDENGTIEAKTATANDGSVEGDDSVYRVSVTSKNAVRVEQTRPGDPGDPVFTELSYDREVAENAEIGSIVGDPVLAVPEGKTVFTYDLDATISGDDRYFTIDEDYGQIRVGDEADATALFVRAAGTADPTLDYEGDNEFVVTVTATDSGDSSRTATAAVTINLRDLNEKPYFDQVSRTAAGITIEHSETQTNRVAAFAATEPDGDGLRWEVTGPDASDFEIIDRPDRGGNDRVELDFKNQPDFENPTDRVNDENDDDTLAEDEGKGNNIYRVTVRATETAALGNGPRKSATLDVTVEVTNSDEDGTLEINWLQPEVGTEISATLTEPDTLEAGTPITVTTWQWYNSKVSVPNRNPDPTKLSEPASEWAMIAGATTATYEPKVDDADTTPDESDVGKYLLVTAIYDDGHSESYPEDTDDDKTAFGISANPVRADVSDEDNNSPDFTLNKITRTVPEDTAVGDPVGRPVVVDTNEDPDILTYELVQTVAENPAVVVEDLEYFSINKATGQISVAKKLSYEENIGVADEDPIADGDYTVVVRATDPSGEGVGVTDESVGENRDDITVTIKATDVEEAPRVIAGARELSVNEADSSKKDPNVTKYVGLGYEIADGATEQTLIADDPTLYLRIEEDLVDVQIWPEPIAGPDGDLFEYSTPDDSIGRRLHFIDAPDYENPGDSNRDNVYELIIRTQDTTGRIGTRNVRVTVNNVNEAGKLVLGPEQPDDGMPVTATLTDPDGVESITDWQWIAVNSRVANYAAALAAAEAEVDDDDEIVGGATTSEHTGGVGQFLWAMVDYRDGFSEENDPVTSDDERNVEAGDPPTTNSDIMRSAGTDNAVQKDPDAPGGPEPADPNDVEIERSVYENVPSTGYVGIPLTGLDYLDSSGSTQTRNELGGPDGSSFVFAELRDDATTQMFYDMAMIDSDNFAGVPDATPPIPENLDLDDKMGQLAANVVTHFDFESGKNTYTVEITDTDAVVPVGVVRVTITVMNVNEAPSTPEEFRGTPGPANAAPEFAAATDTREVAENTAAGESIGAPVAATDADDDDLTYELGGTDAASFAIDDETGQLMTLAALDFETTTSYEVTVTADDGNGGSDTVAVTITVTDVNEDTAVSRYDADNDGSISRPELVDAIRDLLFPADPANPVVTRDEVLELIRVHLFG